MQEILKTFMDIICSKSTNVIVGGCIYKHHALQINYLKSDFISPLLLLLKLRKQSFKWVFFLDDFNIDLLR